MRKSSISNDINAYKRVYYAYKRKVNKLIIIQNLRSASPDAQDTGEEGEEGWCRREGEGGGAATFALFWGAPRTVVTARWRGNDSVQSGGREGGP